MFSGLPTPFPRWLKGLAQYATITLPKSPLARRHGLVAGIPRKSPRKSRDEEGENDAPEETEVDVDDASQIGFG